MEKALQPPGASVCLPHPLPAHVAAGDVLPLDTDGVLCLSANDFVSKRTLVLGQSGSGKSNAEAVIMEGLLAHGLPMTIIDPEGKAWSLKERFPTIVVVGCSAHADRVYAPEDMGRLAELSVAKGFSVVLDLDGYLDEDIYALLRERLGKHLDTWLVQVNQSHIPELQSKARRSRERQRGGESRTHLVDQ
jgi:Helicase HerA, central domain